MHLYRFRRGVPDPSFNAYINTLPTSFFDHPLTVVLENAQGRDIFGYMPSSTAKMLLDVEKRLKDDWEVTTKALVSFLVQYSIHLNCIMIQRDFPDLVPPGDMGAISELSSQFSDFIWAWLNGRFLHLRMNHPPNSDAKSQSIPDAYTTNSDLLTRATISLCVLFSILPTIPLQLLYL